MLNLPANFILLDFLEPGLTISSDHCITIMTKLKVQTFRVRPEKKTTLFCNMTKPTPIPDRRPCVLTHPPYCLDLMPSDFYLFEMMKDGLHGRNFPVNCIIIGAVGHLLQCRNSRSPILVQTVTREACRLLYTTCKNA